MVQWAFGAQLNALNIVTMSQPAVITTSQDLASDTGEALASAVLITVDACVQILPIIAKYRQDDGFCPFVESCM